MSETTVARGIGVAVVVAVFVLTVFVFQRRVARTRKQATPGTWTGGCVDPLQSRAWSALVIDNNGITVKSLWGRKLRYAYAWSEVDVPATGRHEMRIGLRKVEGLRLQLQAGSHVDLLLPSSNLLRYPTARVDSALDAMQRHRSRVAGS